MFQDIISLLYVLLPAYVANMAPVVFKSLFPQWTYPLDCYKMFWHKRVLGDHKTWRGLVLGVGAAIGAAFLQAYYLPASWLQTPAGDWLMIGAALGFGAIVGDSLKSFFKRRRNIKPGKDWVPFDQIDFIIGALCFLYPLYAFTLLQALSVLLISALGHVVIKEFGDGIGLT